MIDQSYLRNPGLFFVFFLCFVFPGQAQSLTDWHKSYCDTLQGLRSKEALAFLNSKHLKPKRQIILAIIDSGIDTTVVDLQAALWKNPKEKLDGKDNDRNGYVDDLNGWNFLGTKDGSFNMISAGTQEYREFKRLFPKYKYCDSTMIPEDTTEYAYYKKMRKKAGIQNYLRFFEYVSLKNEAYRSLDSLLRLQPLLAKDTLTLEGLRQLSMTDDELWNKAYQSILVDIYRANRHTRWDELMEGHQEQFDLMRKRIEGIEKDRDKRLLMGDDMKDIDDRFYGNRILQTEDCEHGTIVAGIIAGQGKSAGSPQGIYPEARLMIIRAVPNGDEYDKDVATAIRYAVDNGAKIINLSLGKYNSPQADMVSQAIAYAARKDVLLLQSAGNNARNIDSLSYFPASKDKKGKVFPNYMRVGASDKQGKPCSFSNYGKEEVDVFAPGVEVTSVTVGGRYTQSQGTSIASPAAAATAAIIRSYFPRLKAAQVKNILIETARPLPSNKYCRGGVIDALRAVESAMEIAK